MITSWNHACRHAASWTPTWSCCRSSRFSWSSWNSRARGLSGSWFPRRYAPRLPRRIYRTQWCRAFCHPPRRCCPWCPWSVPRNVHRHVLRRLPLESLWRRVLIDQGANCLTALIAIYVDLWPLNVDGKEKEYLVRPAILTLDNDSGLFPLGCHSFIDWDQLFKE